jgi:hypothetical protein
MLKFSVGKLITGLGILTTAQGVLEMHKYYKEVLIKRKDDSDTVATTTGIRPRDDLFATTEDNDITKTADQFTWRDSLNYLLWGDTKGRSTDTIVRALPNPEQTIATENQQGWLNWFLWGSKQQNHDIFVDNSRVVNLPIKESVQDTITQMPQFKTSHTVSSWYDYILDSTIFMRDKIEPILGEYLYYLELFVILNLLVIFLCVLLIDLLVFIKFLELLKKVILRLINLFRISKDKE